MNKILKYIGCALMAATTLVACSPDEFTGADPNGLPEIGDRTITISTDQETNTAVFQINGSLQGCYPVWYLDGNMYSLLPLTSYSSLEAGTHELEVKLMNRNGQSQGSLTGSFTFNETKVDWSQYFNKLSGKQWRIDYTEVGHLGCGESGGDGSNWWQAQPNDKADYGVYDDRVTFAHSDDQPVAQGSYTYNPGDGGTVYANKEVTLLPDADLFQSDVYKDPMVRDANGAYPEDPMYSVAPMESTFELSSGTYNDKNCLYIRFAPNTLLPYIPNDGTFADPYFRIEGLTNSRLALVCDNGSIAWRMVFTSSEDTGMPDEPDTPEASFDWDYDSDANIWKTVDTGDDFIEVGQYWRGASWEDKDDLSSLASWSHEGDTWTVNLPEGLGTDQWMGQFHIDTKLSASAAKKYNFYCLIEAEEDCPGVTVKFTDKGDDNYFCQERIEVKGGTPYVFKLEDAVLAKGNDGENLRLFFDFGGCPGGQTVKISKIYFEESVSYNYEDEENMWKTVDAGDAFINVNPYFTGAEWDGALTESFVWNHETGSDVWTCTLPEGLGAEQWKGQFPINTTLTANAADSYYFSCVIESEEDLPGVTIKFTETNYDDKNKRDNNFFFADRHDVKGGTPFVYKMSGVKLAAGEDAHAMSLYFDFGGCPGGANVKISKITFVKQ